MQLLSNQEKWKPWQGVLIQILFIFMLIFLGGYMQGHWGMLGLLATEVMFLATAIIITLIHKTPLKEVFPIKKLSWTDFFGIIFMSVGAILFNFVALGISATVFPNELSEAAELADFMDEGLPFIPFFLIVAVSPAICEESIMRGVLQSHFRGLKKDWLIALLVGCSFGILHLSFLRFLSTAMLGALMAYVMAKKNNILLPALMHFFNNALSAIVSQFNHVDPEVSRAALENVKPGQLLGTYLTIGFAAPLFILLGVMLLKMKKVKWCAWLTAVCLSIFMLGVGFVLVLSTSTNRDTVCKISYTEVASSSEAASTYFSIEEDGNYQIAFVAAAPAGEIEYEISNMETGDVVMSGSGKIMVVGTEFVDMEAGDYQISIYGTDDTDGSEVTVSVQIVNNSLEE